MTVPTILNVTLTAANTEYPQELPANTVLYEFQCRTAYDIRYAWATSKVATPTAPYMTLKSGDVSRVMYVPQSLGAQTLYFASAQAGVVVEIVCHPRSDS